MRDANSETARTRDADIIESVVWVVVACAGVSFVLYQAQEYFEYLVAPALVVIPTVILWRLLAFYRKRRHFNKLKSQLKKTMRTYSHAQQTTESLPLGDRELAARQLEAIKKNGQRICKELSTFRAELRDAKESVMTKLGRVSSDELAHKLAPIRVLEVEVDQLLHEFEPIAKGSPRGA